MTLWQMSFSGAMVIIVIIIVRAVLINKLPKKTFLFMWGLALLRLLIPFSIPSSLSFYSIFNRNVVEGDVENLYPIINLLPAASEDGVLPAQAEVNQNMGNFLSDRLFSWEMVWLSGFVIVALFFAICYIKCFRDFKTSLPVSADYIEEWLKEHPIRRNVSVRQYDRISSPLTYGILRPVILLPKTIDLSNRQQLMFILKHEFVHICRFDLAMKILVIVTLCIHWFNPFVWILYILFNRDLELSCDEAVIKNGDKNFRADYARTLICMEEYRTVSNLLFSNFSKNIMEERIVAIMKPKKYTLLGVVGALALVALIAAGFLTSAQAAEPELSENEKNDIDVISEITNELVSETQKEEEDSDVAQLIDELESMESELEEKIAELEEMASISMVWPTENDKISRNFGTRVHPLTGQTLSSDHICIAGEQGDDVYAALSGTVTESAFDADMGYYVVLTSENGIVTIYAHLESDSFQVSVGDEVNAGDVIAAMGATGKATGPNLAFSVVVDGTPVDPMQYYE